MPKISPQKKRDNEIALALNVLVVMRHVVNTWKQSTKDECFAFAYGTTIEMINFVGRYFAARILAILYGRSSSGDDVHAFHAAYERVMSDPVYEDKLMATERRFMDITPLDGRRMAEGAITPQHVRLAQVAQSMSDLLDVAAHNNADLADAMACISLVHHCEKFDYLQMYVANSIGLDNSSRDRQPLVHRAQALWRALHNE